MKKTLIFIGTILTALTVNAAEKAAMDGQTVGHVMENGNIVMGRVHLAEADKTYQSTDVDVFALRNCASKKNMPVRKLRLHAPKRKGDGTKNLDALIRSVTVIFGNGAGHTFDMPGQGKRLVVTDTAGDAILLDLPGNRRCVRAISVNGEQYEAGTRRAPTLVRVIGVK